MRRPAKDDALVQTDEVSPPAHARDQEFHKKVRSWQLVGEFPKMLDLVFPGIALGGFHLEGELECELSEKLRIIGLANLASSNRDV